MADRRGRRIRLLLTLCTVVASSAWAMLDGPGFTVTSGAGLQTLPAVAYNSIDDRHLVVWQDARSTGSIFGRIYTGQGAPFGAEFQIDELNTGTARQPDLAFNSTLLEYLVVWSDEDVFGSGLFRIYGQRVSRTGALIGGRFAIGPIPAAAAEAQSKPALAYNPTANETFVVWVRDDTDDIFGRRVDADGSLDGAVITVDSGAMPNDFPDVAYSTPSGVYMVVEKEGASEIRAVMVSAAGTVDGQFVLSAAIPGALRDRPAVAYNSVLNEFVAVWEDDRASVPSLFDIFGQRFTAAGVLIGNNFQISDVVESANDQRQAAIDFNQAQASFLVSWQDERYLTLSPPGDIEIFGQFLDVNALPAGANFKLSCDPIGVDADQAFPAVAAGSISNRFMVVFDDDQLDPLPFGDIFGQLVSGGFTQGDIVFADDIDAMSGTDRVRTITPAGTPLAIIDATRTSPRGMAVDPDGNFLLVEQTGGGRLVRITPAGVVSVVATGLGTPYGVAVDKGGQIFVTSSTANDGRLFSISPGGAVVEISSDGSRAYFGVVVDPNDRSIVFAADDTDDVVDDRLIRVSQTGASLGTVIIFGAGDDPRGVAADESGRFTTCLAGANHVVRVNGDGGSPTMITADPLFNLQFITSDENGDFLVTQDGASAEQIVRLPRNGGAAVVVMSPDGPEGIDVIPSLTPAVGGPGAADLRQSIKTLLEAAPDGMISAGETITYTILVRNAGPNSATGVLVTDPIPASTTYNPGTLTLNGAALTDASDGDAGTATGGVVSVNVGTLLAGATATIRFSVTISGAATAGTVITNTATITAANAPTQTVSAIATVGGGPLANTFKTVTDASGNGVVIPGELLTWEIMINIAPSTGPYTSFRVTDNMPAFTNGFNPAAIAIAFSPPGLTTLSSNNSSASGGSNGTGFLDLTFSSFSTGAGGGSITITFINSADNPLPTTIMSLVNQALVTATLGGSGLVEPSDDPTTVPLNDPTEIPTVSGNPPILSGVDPSEGCRGTTVALVISGSNIQQGATVAFDPAAGITIVSGPTVNAAGTQISLTIAIAANAALGPRSIIVTNPGGGSATLFNAFVVIEGVTVPTGYFGTAIATQSVLQFPIGLDVSGQDEVFIAEWDGGRVTKVRQDGQITVILTGLGSIIDGPFDVALDPFGGLLISMPLRGQILRSVGFGNGSFGPPTVFASGLGAPAGMDVDPWGNLIVAEVAIGRVSSISPSGVRTTLVSGLSTSVFVHCDAIGNIFISEFGEDRIILVPAGTTNKLVFFAGVDTPLGLYQDAALNIYVAESGADRVTLIARDGSGRVIPNFATDIESPMDVVVDTTGQVYITQMGECGVVRVTPFLATQLVLAPDAPSVIRPGRLIPILVSLVNHTVDTRNVIGTLRLIRPDGATIVIIPPTPTVLIGHFVMHNSRYLLPLPTPLPEGYHLLELELEDTSTGVRYRSVLPLFIRP